MAKAAVRIERMESRGTRGWKTVAVWTVGPFEIVTMINRTGIVYLGGASPGTCTPLKLYFSPDTDTRKRALRAGSGARGLGGGVRAVDTRAFVDFSVHSSRERTPQLCHARSTNNAAGKSTDLQSSIRANRVEISSSLWNFFIGIEIYIVKFICKSCS